MAVFYALIFGARLGSRWERGTYGIWAKSDENNSSCMREDLSTREVIFRKPFGPLLVQTSVNMAPKPYSFAIQKLTFFQSLLLDLHQ